MKSNILLLFFFLSLAGTYGQTTGNTFRSNMDFLASLTMAVIDSSYVRSGADLPSRISHFGPNNLDEDIIRPGGRTNYPAFWIRDYAMSVESGLIPVNDQRKLLLLTARYQADRAFITGAGSFVPMGSIPDHISLRDKKPIYFPGTIDDFDNQGGPIWRTPPLGDQYYFIHMVSNYVRVSGDIDIVNSVVNGKSLLDRLELAFASVPTKFNSDLVEISENFQTTDFGFRDVITMTGSVLFGSVLKYRASLQMSELYGLLDNEEKAKEYRNLANRVSEQIETTFLDERGMLRASTGLSSQPDVWGTAFAIYTGALSGEPARKTSAFLAEAYKKGTMSKSGYIRHVLTTDDFSENTAWEKSLAAHNTYQNGAYWATPVGWVCYAINITDNQLAQKLAMEFVDTLRETDFRKGMNYGGPYECIFPSRKNYQNPVYMTSVSLPLSAFKRMGYFD